VVVVKPGLSALLGMTMGTTGLFLLLQAAQEVTDVEVELTEVEEGGFIVLEFRPAP
jgi:hypothetical protein